MSCFKYSFLFLILAGQVQAAKFTSKECLDSEFVQIGRVQLKRQLSSEQRRNTVPALNVSALASNNSTSSKTQLAIFSEIYYPDGWKATINGEDIDIIRANYLLRAAVIPPGNNEIVFSFEPESYAIGNMVSMGGSITLIILILLTAFFEFRKRRIKNAE